MSIGTIAIVLKGYPRLSETFIAQEIRELERRGFSLRLISLRHPTDRKRHPVNDEIRAPVSYLPEYLYQEPARVLHSLWRARLLPGFRKAMGQFLRDVVRDPTPNRGRRFGQAAVLAGELGEDVSHIYSHFLHTPSSVARYAATMRELPWSFSAHAKDIWTIPEWEKAEKLADAVWGVTCTAYGQRHLNGLAPAGREVELVYHGIDLDRFPTLAKGGSDRDGSNPNDPVTVVSVGRLVPKKGYDDLLAALAALPESLAWRLVHIGGGELGHELKAQAREAGIGDRIEWRGSQSQQAVIEAMREGDVFALMSRIDESGDRDGLPNVLMEAQSQQLACLATRVAAIPELIVDDETGFLVEPRDRPAMTARLERLITDPALRRRLGAAGCRRVHEVFSHEACIGALVRKFEMAAGHSAIPAARAAE